MKKLNQTGSHIIGILVFVAVLGAVGFIGLQVASKHKATKGTNASTSTTTTPANNMQLASYKTGCKSSGTVPLTHEPMNMSDVGTILPIGTLAGAHVTPIDHLYFYPKDMTHRDAAPVYAMADGYIVNYSERTTSVDSGRAKQGEYQLYFQHSCTFFTYFDLLTSLDPAIKAQIDAAGGKNLHIAVKAGQEIGRVGAQSLDTAAYNLDLNLKGFVNPASYKTELFKLHTDDFFKYFKDPAKSEMLAKDQRKFKPYSGKIDYDIDGKLIGNWFQQGTNGFAGSGQQVGDGSGQGYWSTHLAIVPDALTQGQIDLSFGDYLGKATQFTAAIGSPNPATVSKASGLTKYEFVANNPSGPSATGSSPAQSSQVIGTVLFQLTDKQVLKMEVFPGKTAAEVSGFTGAVKVYTR